MKVSGNDRNMKMGIKNTLLIRLTVQFHTSLQMLLNLQWTYLQAQSEFKEWWVVFAFVTPISSMPLLNNVYFAEQDVCSCTQMVTGNCRWLLVFYTMGKNENENFKYLVSVYDNNTIIYLKFMIWIMKSSYYISNNYC